jgi:hypothetical protein
MSLPAIPLMSYSLNISGFILSPFSLYTIV